MLVVLIGTPRNVRADHLVDGFAHLILLSRTIKPVTPEFALI